MKNMKIIIIWVLTFASLTGLLLSCLEIGNQNADPLMQQTNDTLIIYCENALAPPILELKKDFENLNNCKVIIQNDCAQNLIGIINFSFEGDIFIPSARHEFDVLRKSSKVNLTDSVFLGFNSLVFMVKKGNPKKFTGELTPEILKKFAMIIANPETGSLGYETRETLKQENIYYDVLKNVISLSTDSKGLVNRIKNNEADLVINFASSVHINGSINYVDILPFKWQEQNTIKVFAGVLSTSRHKNLAQSFLDYVSSRQSKSILNKYGISKRKTLIF